MVNEVLEKSDSVIVLSSSWKNFYSDHFNCSNLNVVNNLTPFQSKNIFKKCFHQDIFQV